MMVGHLLLLFLQLALLKGLHGFDVLRVDALQTPFLGLIHLVEGMLSGQSAIRCGYVVDFHGCVHNLLAEAK
jgi:hypothetical protein